MKRFSSILLFISICFILNGQNLKYDRIINQGQLPEDYTTPSEEKYIQSLETSSKDQDNFKNKNTRKEFYLGSTYAIDDLLRSGYILFNDPISKYVNAVMDIIVNSNPKLKSKNPRVYVLRSTAVNAFATDQGIIFISIGLLSQLEDEAQLALILSHELVHIQENHNLQDFIEAARVDQSINKRGRMNTSQIDIANLEKNRYSRDQELEADDKGLDYFLNTDYSFESIERVFDILRYSYLPYDEIAFEKNILEKLSIKIPDDYLLEKVKDINPAEEDEEQSTHPALSKRTRNLSGRLKGLNSTNKKDYIISKENFLDVQLKSRAELARLFLDRQCLSDAIYAGFLMNKIYGDSEFSREVIGKALYGYAKFKNNDLLENIYNPSYKDIEGESQQVFHIMKKLKKEELTILAIAYNYDRYIEDSKDETVRSLISDLFADLYLHKNINSLTGFYTIKSEVDSSEVKIEDKELSKIDKIKQNRPKAEDDGPWQRFAFSEVLQDSTFRNIANEGFELGKELKKEEDYFDTSTYKGRSNLRKYRKRLEKKGRSLGIGKVLIINPLFIQLKGNMSNPSPGLIESDKRRKALKEILESSANLHDVDIKILDANSLEKNDTEVLNDIVIASEWISTQLDAENFLYKSYNQKEIEEISERYNTPYLMSVVVVSVRQSNPIARLFNRKRKSLIFVSIFDVKTGRKSFIKSDLTSNYLNDVFLKSELYDAFSQLSKQN